MRFRFLPAHITSFKPKPTYFLFKESHVHEVFATLNQFDFSIEKQRTPIIFFRKAFHDIEENNYAAVKAHLTTNLPNFKQHFWYTQYPSELIVGSSEECTSKSDSGKTTKTTSGYDEILNDMLVTRIWFDKSEHSMKHNEINVLMERGNFLYSYLLAINNPHRFQLPIHCSN
jgi:hypothetical protein